MSKQEKNDQIYPIAPTDADADNDSESSSSSSDDDDDLVLEGTLMRNSDHDTSSSSDDDDNDDDDDDDDDYDEDTPAKKKQKTNQHAKKTKSKEYGLLHVDFTFHDMKEDFFHGIKTLIHSSSTVDAPHSSALADLMIDNVSIGTVISTEGDTDHNVFGVASVLTFATYKDTPTLQALTAMALQHCPPVHQTELQTVLSGSTQRPAGLLIHSRMINLPLELVLVLHQQLVLDMDWAVEQAQGIDRKALDFGAFVRMAPGTAGPNGTILYKYFDDEIFATNAEFIFSFDAPKAFGADGPKPLCTVIVMTKTGHRQAMKDMEKLIQG